MRLLWALITLLVAVTSLPHASSDETQPHARATIRFERDEQGGVILPVTVNGRGPYRFLLDTGSSHTAVSHAIVDAVGAPVVAKTVTGSVAGSRETLVVRLDALECGPVSVQGVLASLVEIPALGEQERIDGVLGQDVLAPLRYTIDFEHELLRWWPPERVTSGARFELQPSQGRFAVSIPQRQAVVRLVPDSGAGGLVLFEPASGELPITRLRGTARLTTISSQTNVTLARVRELRVGSVTFEDVPAAMVRRDQSESVDVDGLLPLHLFDRVTFDGPGREIILESRYDVFLMDAVRDN